MSMRGRATIRRTRRLAPAMPMLPTTPNMAFATRAAAAGPRRARRRRGWRLGRSLGGVIEGVAAGVPAGWGAPVYAKLDAELAAALMSINAVKGVEIGAGFAAARAKGSDNADPALAGGVTGGIATGEPIVVRAAL